MKHYLIRIECKSPYLTPWRNCTIWGRLCWIVKNGVVPGWNIDDWINAYKGGDPPLIIGDGLPFNAIPVPSVFLANADGARELPKTLSWARWLELCRTGVMPVDENDKTKIHKTARMHVTIDRSTGTAIDGQLRAERGDLPVDGIVILALLGDNLDFENFEKLFGELCIEGWGYGRSYGYGQCELYNIEPIARPESTGNVVTTGHCHLDDNLPQIGFWRLTGAPVLAHDPDTRRALLPHRFTTMLEPGATFQTDDRYLGKTVSAELPGHEDYLHYGLAPAVPVKVEEEKYG